MVDDGIFSDCGIIVNRESEFLDNSLLDGIDALDIELSRVKCRKSDWQHFLREVRKSRVPTASEAALYLSSMSGDERVLFASMLEEIDADYPSLSNAEKKILALETMSILRESEFERGLLELCSRVNLTEEELHSIEAKSRVLGILVKKRGYVLAHFAKQKEISGRSRGDLNDILNNPEVEEFRLIVKKRAGEYSRSSSGDVVDAEYREVE